MLTYLNILRVFARQKWKKVLFWIVHKTAMSLVFSKSHAFFGYVAFVNVVIFINDIHHHAQNFGKKYWHAKTTFVHTAYIRCAADKQMHTLERNTLYACNYPPITAVFGMNTVAIFYKFGCGWCSVLWRKMQL